MIENIVEYQNKAWEVLKLKNGFSFSYGENLDDKLFFPGCYKNEELRPECRLEGFKFVNKNDILYSFIFTRNVPLSDNQWNEFNCALFPNRIPKFEIRREILITEREIHSTREELNAEYTQLNKKFLQEQVELAEKKKKDQTSSGLSVISRT